MHIGISAHQKLEHLTGIVKLLGYESVCVFGDCFDEVTLLDPVQYPGAIKAFAKEVRPCTANLPALPLSVDRERTDFANRPALRRRLPVADASDAAQPRS
jgi:hypothetical protein